MSDGAKVSGSTTRQTRHLCYAGPRADSTPQAQPHDLRPRRTRGHLLCLINCLVTDLRKLEQDLIRARGQSIMYALNDVSKGLEEWEVLRDEHRSHNPQASGMMVADVTVKVNRDLSLRFGQGEMRHDPRAKLHSPTFDRPEVPSHLTVWVPDERVGDTEEVGIFEHCVILTPDRLELAERVLKAKGQIVWSAYQNYVHGNALQVFKVVDGYLRAMSYSADSKNPGLRRAVETVGRCFLHDHSAEESEADQRQWGKVA